MALALAVLRLALLVLWSSNSATKASVPSAAFEFIGAIVIFAMSHLEHTRSVRPSSLLSVYLLFSILFDATQLRTLYLRHEFSTIVGLATASLVVEILLFLLELTSKRSFLRSPYRSWPPETTSGIISRSLFWWINPIFVRGFRKILSLDDLFATDPELLSEKLQEKMENSWKKCRYPPRGQVILL